MPNIRRHDPKSATVAAAPPVVVPPTIVSFAPTTAPAGTPVVITVTTSGTALPMTGVVTMINGSPQPNTEVSATEVQIDSYTFATAGVYQITVNGSAPMGFTVTGPLPIAIDTLTPFTGAVGAHVIVLTVDVVGGRPLDGTEEVTIGGVPRNYVLDTPSQITIESTDFPVAGDVEVIVGDSAPSLFTVT